jgi:protein TonB
MFQELKLEFTPDGVKSVYQSLDEEALRVVSSMPKWAPGKLNGEAVRTKYMIPITFRVE